MFGGELEDVVLQFDRSLVDPVFDKFVENTPMMRFNDTTCAATVHVQISPTFFGWLAQFGNRMKVLTPDCVVDQYKKHIKSIIFNVMKYLEQKGKYASHLLVLDSPILSLKEKKHKITE